MDEMLFCRNAVNGEMTLPLAIGRDENGRPLRLDLAAAPNILLWRDARNRESPWQ